MEELDLHAAWQQLNQPASPPVGKDLLREAIQRDSQLPLQKLQKRLVAKSIYNLVSIPLLAWIILYFDDTLIRALTGAALAIQLAFMALLYRKVKQMKAQRPAADGLLQTLQHHYDQVRVSLKYEEVFGLVAYPLLLPVGMLISRYLKYGSDMLAMLGTLEIVKILVLTLVGIPVCHWMTKKMNQMTFGSYLQQLKENIQALKSE